MKFLSRLLLLCLLGWGTVFAQSNLPACPSSGYFHSCFGTYTVGNGNKYVGEFKYDMLNGKGTYTTGSGIKYVGEFKDGKYNGQGTLYFSNGSVINQGIWADGNFVGTEPTQQATAIDQTVATATQQVNIPLSNLPACPSAGYLHNCFGTFTFADGKGYVGEFKDGKYNGQGTFTFASGGKYIGEWKDNRHNGQGTLYGSNGLVINQGIWTDGKLVGSVPAQQLTTSNSEIEKLRAEADEAKRKQVEAEAQLKLAQQSVQPNKPTVSSVNERRVALVIGNATYMLNGIQN